MEQFYLAVKKRPKPIVFCKSRSPVLAPVCPSCLATSFAVLGLGLTIIVHTYIIVFLFLVSRMFWTQRTVQSRTYSMNWLVSAR